MVSEHASKMEPAGTGEFVNTKELANQAEKISKSSTFNQVTVLHQDKNDV